jgi:hypothetical protein
MHDEPFDIDAFKWVGKTPPQPEDPKLRRRSREFVKVFLAQSDRLDKAVNVATIKVFLHLLRLDFKSRGKPVRLANADLSRKGIHRKAKSRALYELETLGLIGVERRPRKSPEITILQLPDGST